MKTGKKIDKDNLLHIFIVILAVILVFAFIDYIFHQLNEEYAVPSYYFRNKIIFGTLIGCIVYYFARNLTTFKKALAFSAIVSVLLQVRYYYEGYPKDFVFEFLGIHFGILIIVSWLAFKYLLSKK